ncbi:hypothetical protein ACOI1H_24710 [Loktanella sp. DJP18]|uniref:hypothetical protein n=1 Tax=Loktanella sp. DJP18 TaxID=3409788 RepID=UPI003BB5800B
MKRFSTLLLSAALLTGPASAQVVRGWDLDSDGILSQDEWNAGLTELGVLSEWDEDGDGALVSDEFAGGLFERFDEDNSGTLTVGEWDSGIDSFYGEAAVDASFENWNTDGDEVLSEEEFMAQFMEAGLFENYAIAGGTEVEIGAWDADGDSMLSEDEFFEGWGSTWGDSGSAFNTWDGDADGLLSEDEYNTGVFSTYDRDGSGFIEEPEFGDVGDDIGDGGFWDV